VRKKYWSIGVLLALGLIGGWLLALRPRSDEPSFQGKALGYWVRRIWHSDDQVRARTEEALRQMGSSAVPPLIKMLSERDGRLVTLYNRGIGMVGGARSWNWMAGGQSQRAAAALQVIGPTARDAIPFLIANMTNYPRGAGSPSPYAYALEFIGTKSVLPLVDALSHPDPDVRMHAGIALSYHHTNLVLALPQLLKLLRTDDDATRAEVVRLLGLTETEHDTVIPVLTECLRDRSADVRGLAARSLAYRGPAAASALPRLMSLLGDDDPDVQRAAASAITNIAPARRIETSR
jgi:HEAT repeat protein